LEVRHASDSERGPRRHHERRAYGEVQSHYALRACEVIEIGSRFGLGTIKTLELNSSAFDRQTHGRHEVPPIVLEQKQSRFLARRLWRRQRLFRRGGGSTSKAIAAEYLL
jgi:prolyl-tRNA synthetase